METIYTYDCIRNLYIGPFNNYLRAKAFDKKYHIFSAAYPDQCQTKENTITPKEYKTLREKE